MSDTPTPGTNPGTTDGMTDGTSDGATGGKDAGSGRGPSVATQLVRMAHAGYELGCSPDGDLFAVPKAGPPIVRMLRGGRHSLRAALAEGHYERTGAPASQSALADACAVLEGAAARTDPQTLYLRVGTTGEDLVLDLGDASGRAVVITPHTWKLTDEPPVLFQRTALTGPLPEPVGGCDFAGLWDALNVAGRYQPIVLAVLVAALMPNLPHPVVLLTGEQGTGKSTATARLASVIDPSPAQLRKAPRDVEAWTTAAAGSWIVPVDNLSAVSDWLSDALCRASTGDGDVRRRLYSDNDLHVIAFRRVPLINGIDVGALRGDLADRLVHLALERIPDAARRRDAEMAEQWRQAHPQVLGALLDLTVQVLAALPAVRLDSMPRMADFARVLAAVDTVCGTDGLSTYLGLRDELAEDAAGSDPVLVALGEHVTGEFRGTSAELAGRIHPRDENGMPLTDRQLPKGWPTTARALTAILARQAPVLRQLGWTVRKLERGTDPHIKTVRWQLHPPARHAEQTTGQEDAERGGGQHDGPRRCVSGAADAANAADDAFAQVRQAAEVAASRAASLRQPRGDAANPPPEPDPAASAPRRRTDAAADAAALALPLTSENEDRAASAANAAPQTHHLGPSSVHRLGQTQ